MRVQILVKGRFQLGRNLSIDCVSRIVDAAVGKHAAEVSGEDVERQVVCLAFQPLLDQAKVDGVLQQPQRRGWCIRKAMTSMQFN